MLKKTPRLIDLSEKKCPVCENQHCLSYQSLSARDRRNRIRRFKCSICDTKGIPMKPAKRKCLDCRKPFETFKEDKVYCHPRCRVRAFRKNEKERLELDRIFIRKIIDNEGINPDTV